MSRLQVSEKVPISCNMVTFLSRRLLLDRRRARKYLYIVSAIILLSLIVLIFTNRSETKPETPTEQWNISPKKKCNILIMIISTPKNSKNRDLLRFNSYLGYPWVYNRTDVNFEHVFILGKTKDKDVNDLALREAVKHGDIAIGNFEDSYNNLSEKVIWGFNYALRNFDFKFCVKVDEDSFINMAFLAAHLRQVDSSALQNYYAGKPRQGDLTLPKAGKFRIESGELNGMDKYVQYNLGGGYILSQPSMTKILAAHRLKAVEVVAWEDVYIGLLANLINIKPTRIYHYYVSKFHPFCTDVKTILLHHTPPDLQARMLSFYNKEGIYCPKDLPEDEVIDLINSQDVIDWRAF